MIKAFKDREAERVFNGRFSKKLPQDIQRIAERKLIMLHRSANLNDLRIPLSNRLAACRSNSDVQFFDSLSGQFGRKHPIFNPKSGVKRDLYPTKWTSPTGC